MPNPRETPVFRLSTRRHGARSRAHRTGPTGRRRPPTTSSCWTGYDRCAFARPGRKTPGRYPSGNNPCPDGVYRGGGPLPGGRSRINEKGGIADMTRTIAAGARVAASIVFLGYTSGIAQTTEDQVNQHHEQTKQI